MNREDDSRICHRFKNDLQVILGLGRIGDFDELASYVRAASSRYSANGADVTGDYLWSYLMSSIRELLEAGVDFRLEVTGWSELPEDTGGAVTSLQELFDSLLEMAEELGQVTVLLDGVRSCVEVLCEGKSERVIKEYTVPLRK